MLALLATAPRARAQGFAGLGENSTGYAQPDRARPIIFPQDHGPHPGFRIEWWYLTAPMTFVDTGAPLGIQWTLFRSALSPGGALAPGTGVPFATPQAWLGHAALTTAQQHLVAERYARGGTGQAGASGTPFRAWIDEWQMSGPNPAQITLNAGGAGFRYDLALEAEGPLVRHGEGGVSVKSAAGQASYYYSQPFYRVRGQVDLGQGARAVTGQGWLDREWSSQPLAADQSGWDWASLFLEDGRRVMVFRLRGRETFVSGSLIAADGTVTSLSADTTSFTPAPGAREGPRPPVNWALSIPDHGISVRLAALNPASDMTTRIPYWEGPVGIDGSHRGRGYLEMTGYAAP